MKRVCRFCGEPEDEHHEPEWIEVPDGCVCNPLTWDKDVIPPSCAEYVGNGRTNCERCEHDKECHTPNNGVTGDAGGGVP
jgi:hypothetical protein